MTLKQQVQKWCKENRRPMGYLAEQVGITGGMLSQVLNGKRTAQPEVLEALEREMGLEAHTLPTS